MDARYDDTLERMCRLADVIKVSDEDLRGLFRVADHTLGLAQIAAWNPDAWLLLTRGAAGATLYRGGQQWSAAPPKVAVVDTVGAGDASMAGFLFSLLSAPDAPPAQHLAWAVAAGAAACTCAGASPPGRAQVADLASGVTPCAL
jgi:fructokinase